MKLPWVAAGLMFIAMNVHAYDVNFSKNDIQQKIDAMDPIKISKAHGEVTMSRTKVRLQNNNRIGVDSIVTASTPFIKKDGIDAVFNGTVSFSGTLKYGKEAGAFFISNIQVEKVNFPQLNQNKSTEVILGKLLENSGNTYFKDHPVYVLKDDLKQQLIKQVLKEITISENGVTAEIGF